MTRIAVCLVLAVLGASALALAQAEDVQKITRTGVGKLKLGMTHKEARELGLVGRKRPGCPLGGTDTRGARLKEPLEGNVNYTQTRPRRVRDIQIRDGATARGVGIRDTIPEIKAAFPKAKVDHSTDETFQLTLVRIPRKGGGKIVFGVSTKTDKVKLIGVPYIAFCE